MKTTLILFVLFMYSSMIAQNTCLHLPDTICSGTEITLSTHCTFNTQYWNFCGAQISEQPVIMDRGTLPYMHSPVRVAVAEDNGIYYAFWTNFFDGHITKCVFGNSLRNIPVTYDLGNIDSLFSTLNEGIQLIKENGKWLAFVVGSGDKLFRIEFGTSLDNPAPSAVIVDTLGNMGLPHGLYIMSDNENGGWIGLVANANNNSFTRIVWPDSLTGPCYFTNSGNVPGVSYPTSIYPVKENDSCYAIVTSRSSNEIYTFNFGDSYLNNQMTITNHGNVGGGLNEPFDVVVIRDCDKSFGVVSCKYHMSKLTMPQGVGGSYTGSTLFNGYLNRAEGISNAIRQNDSLYFLVMSASNKLTVLAFGNCSGTVPSYSGSVASDVLLPDMTTYQVSLFLNEGQYDQVSECTSVTVIAQPDAPYLYMQNDTLFAFPSINTSWFLDGQIIPLYHQPYVFPAQPGFYYAINSNGFCDSDTSNAILVTSGQGESYSPFEWYGCFDESGLDLFLGNGIENVTVCLYDMSGRMLVQEIPQGKYSSHVRLETPSLAPGMYIVQIGTGGDLLSKRVIKAR